MERGNDIDYGKDEQYDKGLIQRLTCWQASKYRGALTQVSLTQLGRWFRAQLHFNRISRENAQLHHRDGSRVSITLE